MNQEPTKPTANTMEQINMYAELTNPTPNKQQEKKPEMETKKDLEKQVEETRQRYLDLTRLSDHKKREGDQTNTEAEQVFLNIKGLEADRHEVPLELTKRHQRLKKEASATYEEAEKAHTKSDQVNADLRELEINLKNWIELLNLENLTRLHSEIQEAQADIDRINEKMEEINSIDRSGYTEKLNQLRAEREDLAAQVVLGEEPEAKLTDLDTKIRETEELCRADSIAMKNQAGVLVGLQKRLDEAQSRLNRKEGEISEARHNYLLTQADKTAKQYIAAASKLAKLDRKMKAFGQVLKLVRNGDDSLKIPSYTLPAFYESYQTPRHNHSDPKYYGSKYHSCEAEEKQIRDELDSYKN